MSKITIYTDGSSKGNPGRGGWSAILISENHQKEIFGGFQLTTNNRMELFSVISALESLKTHGHDITIYSDSQYVVNSVQKGWLFKWVKDNKINRPNWDLWERFLTIYKLDKIKFEWVKGHADNKFNNRCDELAQNSTNSNNLPKDLGYERNL